LSIKIGDFLIDKLIFGLLIAVKLTFDLLGRGESFLEDTPFYSVIASPMG
jgi:hypothetical protein